MLKLWAFVLLLALCSTQGQRLNRSADSSPESDESSSSSDSEEHIDLTDKDLKRIEKANISVDQYRQVKALAAGVKEWNPATTVDFLSKSCEILNPDQKASAVNVTSAQQEYIAKFVNIARSSVVDTDKIKFTVIQIHVTLHGRFFV